MNYASLVIMNIICFRISFWTASLSHFYTYVFEVKLEAIWKIMLTVKISTQLFFFTINMQSQTHHMVYIRNAKCLLFITEGSTSPVSKDWLSFIFP